MKHKPNAVSIVDRLPKSRQMPVAIGNAMKNPALESATFRHRVYQRGEHRRFWDDLRNHTDSEPVRIHLSF